MCAKLTLPPPSLTRYSRQIILPSFGLSNQVILSRSSVLVIGAGGLGCPAVMYLAGCGVGRITIVDNDKVELSNLHRQVTHRHEDIGRYKAECLKRFVEERNGDVQVDVWCEEFNKDTYEKVGVRGVRASFSAFLFFFFFFPFLRFCSLFRPFPRGRKRGSGAATIEKKKNAKKPLLPCPAPLPKKPPRRSSRATSPT